MRLSISSTNRSVPSRRSVIASRRLGRVAALICAVVFLAAVPRSFADDINAALISDPALWQAMHQVMGGVSQGLPIQQPLIRTPRGLYAGVLGAEAQAAQVDADNAAAQSRFQSNMP